MPGRRSDGQGEAGVDTNAQERHIKRVRWVLHQVWNEFYANKPKVNIDLTREKSIHIEAESSLQGSRKALHQQMQAKYANHVNAIPKLLPSLGPGKLGSSVAVEFKGKHRSLKPKTKALKSGSSGPIATCPQYTFCGPTDHLIRVWHDYTMSFIPMLGGDEEVARYLATFKWALADKEGLDPDFDIIAFETVKRLKEGGMTENEIDATHLLPVHCNEIVFYDSTRDLPAFPTVSPDGRKIWKSRPPGITPARHGREGGDTAELFCPRVECGFGCQRHIGDAKNETIVVRRLAMATADSDLMLPDQPCSADCALHLNSHDLEPRNSQETPRLTFTKDTLSQMLLLLPGLKSEKSTFCEAAVMLGGPTCKEVALELKIWRTRVLLQEDSKPMLNNDGEIIQPALDAVKDIPQQPDLPIDFTYPSLAYCTHRGPCGATCPCSQQQAACERTCHCDVNCPRRWRGCRCRADPAKPNKKCIPGKCPCKAQNRECDPGVCSSHSEPCATDPPKGPQCQNMATRDINRPKCVVRVSNIPNAGYGLFASEFIPKGRAIGQYTGEVVEGKELDRRFIIYKDVGRNYAYEVSPGLYVDGHNFGNRTRFFNGSSAKANVVSEILNVSGEPRVIIWTSRAIEKGEEMLLDYGKLFSGAGHSPQKAKRGRPSKKVKVTEGGLSSPAAGSGERARSNNDDDDYMG